MESLNTKLYEKYKKLKVLLFPCLASVSFGRSRIWLFFFVIWARSSQKRKFFEEEGWNDTKDADLRSYQSGRVFNVAGNPSIIFAQRFFLLEMFDRLENRVSCSCGGPDWRIEEYEWAASCEIVRFNWLMTWSNWSSLTYQESEERLNFVLLWLQVFHSGAVCWMREVTAWREQEM